MNKRTTRRTDGPSTGRVLKTIFGSIGRFIATCFMVGIITGCMVACVMTVYIFSYIGSEDPINLDDVELGYTSVMLYYNKETETYEELQKLYITDNNRIWVNYEDISNYVKKAVIAVEDKRFAQVSENSKGELVLEGGHQGVDWRRTFGAFANMFLPGASTGGGSTLTQQLIKNVTDDDDIRVDRKVREIFRALELEKRYPKARIIEAYLNVVAFGSGTNGIETASLTYFGKSAKDLDLAESAAIVGITRAPTAYNPFLNPENNKERQEYILGLMLEQGLITQKEHDDAVKQPLDFKREEYQAQVGNIMSYFEDHVINSVLSDLQEQKDWTYNYAHNQLYKSGYKIYTTVDLEMQRYLEDLYLNSDQFPAVNNATYPQSACNIIDPNGMMLATVGGIGEKDRSLSFSRATMANRHPGSSIKPIGAYALAFEYNRVNWSTIIVDGPINIAAAGRPEQMWPTNYYSGYYGPVTVAYAVQQSVNTIPVKLVQALEPESVFNFMHDRLDMRNLVATDNNGRSDIDLAPMALGALTRGVTGLEMVGAYQIFDNGGTFTTPYCYTKVEDANGRVVLEADTTKRHVITEETSVVMNKILQNVTAQGTGTAARLSNMPTAGKTGTSDDDVNQWFIGMTPYYVCQVWLGYDEETRVNDAGNTVANSIGYYGLGYPPPKLWKTIMEPLHEGLEYKQFHDTENVISREYCTQSGLLATSNCTSTATGWYKADRLPRNCSGHPNVAASSGSGESGDDDAGSDSGDSGGDEDGGAVAPSGRGGAQSSRIYE